MITVSIVIPTYNAQDFIIRCLDSVCNQTFYNLDIIVVDDASTDKTVSIVNEYRLRDSRIKLIEHESNQGTLVTRCDGIRQSTGDYITFLDQDDELKPEACETACQAVLAHPVDIFHFGVEVVGESVLAQSALAGMSAFMNPPAPRTLCGDYILEYAFKGLPQGFDWNVHHKLINRRLAQDVEQHLKREYLTLPDDAYIMFAIEALANSYEAAPDSPWYIYRVGKGATLSEVHSLDKVKAICSQNLRAYELSRDFAREHLGSRKINQEVINYALDCLGIVLCESTVNEIMDHLDEESRAEALGFVKKSWPSRFVQREQLRIIRDREYSRLTGKASSADVLPQVCNSFCLDIDKEYRLDSESVKEPFSQMKTEALINESLVSRRLGLLETWNQQKIRIFVATHRESHLFNSNILQPVQVGAANASNQFFWALHDGDGDNISNLNPSYCELTAQYLAWKNLDAEYYGLCHYRRYFSFNEKGQFPENEWGEVVASTIDDNASIQFGIDDETITRCVDGVDVVLPILHDVREFPEGYVSNRDQYERAAFLSVEDLDSMIEILKREHPDYSIDAEEYLSDTQSFFCNMFVMKKQLFFDYCAWLFPLLEKFCVSWDTTNLGIQALRTPGHLAERLLNIYIRHQIRMGSSWKIKYLQCVHFTDIDVHYALESVEPRISDDGPVVPVVLAASNNYVPMLAATIQSVVANIRKTRMVDIVVLTQDIDWRNQELLRKYIAEKYENVALRFISIGYLVAKYELITNNPHISIDTFLRFLIPEVLPFYKKAVYLDCDLIVEADIVDFFDIDLGSNILGATHDVDYLGNLNMDDGIRMKYSKSVLKMKDPYDYFQAGVLLLNLEQMRALHSTEEWMSLASNSEYIYDDQDILNAECEGRVKFIDASWNVTTDIFNRVNAVYTRAPKIHYENYLEARKNPKIIHYAGAIKPWSSPYSDFSELFWKYAQRLPFYEMQLESIFKKTNEGEDKSHSIVDKAKRAAWKTADVMAPYKSRRREIGKKFLTIIGRR